MGRRLIINPRAFIEDISTALVQVRCINEIMTVSFSILIFGFYGLMDAKVGLSGSTAVLERCIMYCVTAKANLTM